MWEVMEYAAFTIAILACLLVLILILSSGD